MNCKFCNNWAVETKDTDPFGNLDNLGRFRWLVEHDDLTEGSETAYRVRLCSDSRLVDVAAATPEEAIAEALEEWEATPGRPLANDSMICDECRADMATEAHEPRCGQRFMR